MLWLRWLEKDDARLIWLRATHAMEADMLGPGHQPRHRQQALAVRHRGDRLAAEREACAAEAVDAVCCSWDGRLNRQGKRIRLWSVPTSVLHACSKREMFCERAGRHRHL